MREEKKHLFYATVMYVLPISFFVNALHLAASINHINLTFIVKIPDQNLANQQLSCSGH